ncbi:MAG: hypothetical protein ABI967_12560 [bacterium]
MKLALAFIVGLLCTFPVLAQTTAPKKAALDRFLRGGQNFHGKLEFNSRRGLEKTTENR